MVLISFFAVLGALLASFVGVVAERIHSGQSWRKGRSRCNSCRRELTARDLVPALSWLLHAGRCRTCGARIPALYTLSEIVLGILFAVAYMQFGLSFVLLWFLLALLVLAFIVLYDLRHTLVLPQASAALILLALCFRLAVGGVWYALAAACCIALFFFLLYALSRGRAMGLGDTPVSFGLALLSGPAALPGLFFSFWIGGVIGILILVLRRGGPRMGIEVPFVPFMAAGFLLALLTQWNPLPF